MPNCDVVNKKKAQSSFICWQKLQKLEKFCSTFESEIINVNGFQKFEIILKTELHFHNAWQISNRLVYNMSYFVRGNLKLFLVQ
jgi:hypothetical protein